MTWPPSDYPVAVNKANATTSTTDHPAHHNALGNVANDTVALVTDYIAALGKVTASGHFGRPTMFDPDSSAWDDRGWWHVIWNDGQVDWDVGYGTHTVHGTTAAQGVSYASVSSQLYAEDTAGALAAQVLWGAKAQADGSDLEATLSFQLQGIANPVDLYADLFYTYFRLRAFPAQAVPILDLRNSSDATVFGVNPEDGAVGGVTPNVGDSIKWDGTKWAAAA